MTSPDFIEPFRNIMSPNGDGQSSSERFASFSSRLRESSADAGYNAARLAAEAGVTRGTMARYWRGARMFPADVLIRVSDILGVNLRWLATGEGGRAPLAELDPSTLDEEARLLDAFRRLTASQREHVVRNAELIAAPRTLHSGRTRYRGQGEG